jgi:hypothetical protein
MLERPPTNPPDVDARVRLRRRHRRDIRTRSAARSRRGDWFWKREVTASDRDRLVELGHIRRDEADDRDAVEAALEAIVAEALWR